MFCILSIQAKLSNVLTELQDNLNPMPILCFLNDFIITHYRKLTKTSLFIDGYIVCQVHSFDRDTVASFPIYQNLYHYNYQPYVQEAVY